MPPKAPKAKPKPVPRRGAAAKPSAEEALATLAAADVTAGEASSSTAAAAPAAEPEPELPAPPKESQAIAPPKGRLDSLSSTRGGATAGGSKIKFKPRMIARKSKE
jgi:hypothetical protein